MKIKIFYKRDFELATEVIEDLQILLDEANAEIDYLNQAYKKLSSDYGNLSTSNKTYVDRIIELEKLLDLKEQNITTLETKIKKVQSANGGLTRSKNNLEKKVEELKKLLPKVRKLPPAVPRKSRLEMKTKRGVTNSGAKAILKSKNESEEKE